MPEKTEQAMTVYIDGQPVAATGTLPEFTTPAEAEESVKPLNLDASMEFKIDPEQAARLVASMTAAWQAIVLSFDQVAAAFSAWIRSVAGEIAEAEELETALRWASCDNRPLFNRYRHTKKKRIRKKYAKRILAWYREEVLGE